MTSAPPVATTPAASQTEIAAAGTQPGTSGFRADRPRFSAAFLGRFGLSPADVPSLPPTSAAQRMPADQAAEARLAVARVKAQTNAALFGMASSGGLAGTSQSIGLSDPAGAGLALSTLGRGAGDARARLSGTWSMLAEWQQRLADLQADGADPKAIRSAERLVGALAGFATQRLMSEMLFSDRDEPRRR